MGCVLIRKSIVVVLQQQAKNGPHGYHGYQPIRNQQLGLGCIVEAMVTTPWGSWEPSLDLKWTSKLLLTKAETIDATVSL
jgi:hypothetical protein